MPAGDDLPQGTQALRQAAARWALHLDGSRAGRVVLDFLRAAAAVARGFRGEKITLRASALTYITMLSLVPLLAVVFAIVRALGQESLRRAVHDFVFSNLAPGVREQIGGYLDEFIARASGSAMGGLGGVFLLASAAGLFHNIERSLDEIWGVTRSRSLLKRVVIYWCVLTLGPIALGASVFASGLARSAVEHSLPKGVLGLAPWGATVLLFGFLYYAVPHAKVQLRPALAGALVAASTWELAKHLYTFFASHAFRYNAIYGSLGVIPLFLVWVYVCWVIVLFGARLAYALQYAITSANAPRADDPRAREVMCARIALEAVIAFQRGAPAPTPASIGRALALSPAFVAEAAAQLKSRGILAEAAGNGLVPARAPEQIRLDDVAQAAGGTLFRSTAQPPPREEATRALWAIFDESDRQGREALRRVELATLAKAYAGTGAEPRPEKAVNS